MLALVTPSVDAQVQLTPEDLRSVHEEVVGATADLDPFDHDGLRALLDPVVRGGAVGRFRLGNSAEGRRLVAYTAGHGPRRVLLWSQADGAASLGTLVLADVLRYIGANQDGALPQLLRDSLTIVAFPLVNPDGAAAASPRNSHGVEVLLDGRRRATPEARALMRAAEFVPDGLAIGLERAEVGAAGTGAYSLYVPSAAAADLENARPAAAAAGAMARAIATYGSRAVSRSVASADPRRIPHALGSSSRGVAVLGLPEAVPGRVEARFVGFSAVLEALHSMALPPSALEASESFAAIPPGGQEQVVAGVDLLIRRVQLRVPGLPPIYADMALDFDDAERRTGGRVVEVGDLSIAAQDTLAMRGVRIDVRREGARDVGDGHHRLEIGSPAEFDLHRRTLTVLRTLYTVRHGAMTQPPDHRFPRRPRWFGSVQPPFMAKELSRHHTDVETALEEVGWITGAEGSKRSVGAWQVTLGRSFNHDIALELTVGGSDRLATVAAGLFNDIIRLEQNGYFAGWLVSYEHRHWRVAGGPAVIQHRWKWAEVQEMGARASGAVVRPGLIWEASASLPGGTRWAPELRVQQRSFMDAEVGGFGIIPPFPVRTHSFAVSLGTTFRWWAPR